MSVELSLPARARALAEWGRTNIDKKTRAQTLIECADEIERLRSVIFAIEIHGGSAETYDPVVDAICRDALEYDPKNQPRRDEPIGPYVSTETGKERKGKERKGKERKGKERKGKKNVGQR